MSNILVPRGDSVKTVRIERALADLFYFLTYYWGLDLEELPHRKMCDALQQAETNDETPNCMEIVPRGTYKSSIMAGTMVWRQLRQIYLYHNVYHRQAFASATLSLGYRTLSIIENVLRAGGKDRHINEDFGPLWMEGARGQKGSRCFKGDGINFIPRLEAGEIASCPEPNIWIASAKRVSTGWHADELCCDDLHDDKSVLTPVQREKAKQYYRLLIPILMPTDRTGRVARITLNATRWHDDDVPGMVLDMIEQRSKEDPNYRNRWLIIHEAACTDPTLESGDLFFPSKLTREVLKERLDDLGPYLFSCNYLNDPIGQRGFIHEDQIAFVSASSVPPLRYVRATVDPNQHTKAKALGCWAAILVSGYDRFANLYVIGARGSREWDSSEFMDALFSVAEEHDFSIPILIEEEHMAHFENALRLEEERRSFEAGHRVRLNVHWIPVDRNQTYQQRWARLIPRFQRGQIFFVEEMDPRIKREIKSELVRGEASKYSDFLDALAMAESGVRPKIDRSGAPVLPPQPSQAVPRGLSSGAPTYFDMLPPDMRRKVVASEKS